MIDLNERQYLVDIVCSPEVYGTVLPTKNEKHWICPHCRLEGDIEKITAHLESDCKLSYNEL